MVKRGNTYFSRFRAQGKLVRKRLSTDYRTAVELLNEERARSDKADYGLVDNDYSWAKLRDEFLRWARQSVRNWRVYDADLKAFESYAPIKNVREVDHARIVAFREWRLAQRLTKRPKAQGATPKRSGVTPRTVNRQVGTLHNMLAKGVKWGRIGHNPIADLDPLRHESPSKERRALSVDEVQSVFDNSPDYLRPVWRCFMCTGLRRTELASLRFEDVDFERRTALVRASVAKSGKAREVPLDDETFATICRLRDEAPSREPGKGTTESNTAAIRRKFSRDHVFVTTAATPWGHNLLRAFYAVCRRAEIEDAHQCGAVDIHSLRVTFTTLAIEHGANPKDVQAILGHSTLALTMNVYSKATERGKRAAVGVLPFASATAPSHVVSLQNERKVCASSTVETQGVTAYRLAKAT